MNLHQQRRETRLRGFSFARVREGGLCVYVAAISIATELLSLLDARKDDHGLMILGVITDKIAFTVVKNGLFLPRVCRLETPPLQISKPHLKN